MKELFSESYIPILTFAFIFSPIIIGIISKIIDEIIEKIERRRHGNDNKKR